jgi:hypothetical protein
MLRKTFLPFLFILVLADGLISCDNEGTDNSVTGLKYSVQVNNQASSKSIAAGDTIELYINNFEYNEDANNRALILIADGNRDMGSKGGILDNAGWYSVDSELAVTNDVNNGPYSSFQIRISKLRVNGTEYDFPNDSGVFFGHPSAVWMALGKVESYPDNFSGINMTDSVYSLKTILTVEPDILDAAGIASDPYQYIKVEGRVNE